MITQMVECSANCSDYWWGIIMKIVGEYNAHKWISSYDIN